MPRSRLKSKGRRETGLFIQIPNQVLMSQAFRSLPHGARSLLIDLTMQFNGYNNGDLTMTASVMFPYGWNSNASLTKFGKMLEECGLVRKTRQGARNKKASLYAITWRPINECSGKHYESPTIVAPNDWKRLESK